MAPPPPRSGLVKVAAAWRNENHGLPVSFNFLPQRCSTGTCNLCSSPLCPSLSNRRQQSKAAPPGKSREELHALPCPLPVLCPKVCNWPPLSPHTKAVLRSSLARFDVWVEACLEGTLTASHCLVSSSGCHAATLNMAALKDARRPGPGLHAELLCPQAWLVKAEGAAPC